MALGTKHMIFLGYTIFLVTYFTISTGIGVTFLTGKMPYPAKPRCTFGLLLIDGLVDCAWQYLQPFFALFDLTSSIGIFNAIILVPYFLFLAYLIVEIIRGVS
jgi:hypothetical protein